MAEGQALGDGAACHMSSSHQLCFDLDKGTESGENGMAADTSFGLACLLHLQLCDC